MDRYSQKPFKQATMYRFALLFFIVLGGASLVGCQVDVLSLIHI